jgi:hypothetical protein
MHAPPVPPSAPRPRPVALVRGIVELRERVTGVEPATLCLAIPSRTTRRRDNPRPACSTCALECYRVPPCARLNRHQTGTGSGECRTLWIARPPAATAPVQASPLARLTARLVPSDLHSRNLSPPPPEIPLGRVHVGSSAGPLPGAESLTPGRLAAQLVIPASQTHHRNHC